MIKFINAKINLGLDILRKRADGYHELETLFYPVGLFNGTPENPEPFGDVLEIHLSQSRGKDEYSFTGNAIDCPQDKNLVCKAIRAFRDYIKDKNIVSVPQDGFRISLDKHIPDGAGLGGGSADATFTILEANRLYGFPLKREELITVAKSVGADCPFFIENRPVVASGIGEIMRPIDLNLSGFWAVIVKPDIHISTREAFAGITPAESAVRIPDIICHPVAEWRSKGLKNDFEPHIFKIFPLLADIKTSLYIAGAEYAAMSGSGSSVFGLFNSREAALKTYRLSKEKYFCYLCKL